MRHGGGLHGFRGVPRRGIFFGLHHGFGGGVGTLLVVVLLGVVVVLMLRGRR
jgi:hypothetical protein